MARKGRRIRVRRHHRRHGPGLKLTRRRHRGRGGSSVYRGPWWVSVLVSGFMMLIIGIFTTVFFSTSFPIADFWWILAVVWGSLAIMFSIVLIVR